MCVGVVRPTAVTNTTPLIFRDRPAPEGTVWGQRDGRLGYTLSVPDTFLSESQINVLPQLDPQESCDFQATGKGHQGVVRRGH